MCVVMCFFLFITRAGKKAMRLEVLERAIVGSRAVFVSGVTCPLRGSITAAYKAVAIEVSCM